MYRIWPKALDAMVMIKPATVISWHRKGFRLYWKRRSRHLGRPGINRDVRDLIRKMSTANPLWGAPRMRTGLHLFRLLLRLDHLLASSPRS